MASPHFAVSLSLPPYEAYVPQDPQEAIVENFGPGCFAYGIAFSSLARGQSLPLSFALPISRPE